MTVSGSVAANIKTEIQIHKPRPPPLPKVKKVGQILVKNGDEVIATVHAITQSEAPRAGFFGVLWTLGAAILTTVRHNRVTEPTPPKIEFPCRYPSKSWASPAMRFASMWSVSLSAMWQH